MDAIRADADARVAEVEREGARQAEALAAERAGLESDRAQAQAARERAETEIREARDAQLRAEGEVASALRRIAELEQALIDAEAQRKAEVAAVRREEREEFRLALRELNVEIGGRKHLDSEPAQGIPHLEPVTTPVRQMMSQRHHRMLDEVAAGNVTRLQTGSGSEFRGVGGNPLPHADRKVLSELARDGFIGWSFNDGPTVETPEGTVARVVITDPPNEE
jgi:multidrug efflux pump subunit AcrA (membrane-fusion protein)